MSDALLTELCLCCHTGDVKRVRDILRTQRGQEIMNDISSLYDRPALHEAVWENNVGCVYALSDAGANLNVVDENGETPLMIGIFTRSVASINALVTEGADVNFVCRANKFTALHCSAYGGWATSMRMLLGENIKLDERCQDGYTALMYTIINLHRECFEMLLDFGASVDVRNNLGETALQIAVAKGNANAVSLLLHTNVDSDKVGNTPLTVAARAGNVSILQLLIGADAYRDEDIPLAMLYAAAEGHVGCFEFIARAPTGARRVPTRKRKR